VQEFAKQVIESVNYTVVRKNYFETVVCDSMVVKSVKGIIGVFVIPYIIVLGSFLCEYLYGKPFEKLTDLYLITFVVSICFDFFLVFVFYALSKINFKKL
jgi:hypothetical protein